MDQHVDEHQITMGVCAHW